MRTQPRAVNSTWPKCQHCQVNLARHLNARLCQVCFDAGVLCPCTDCHARLQLNQRQSKCTQCDTEYHRRWLGGLPRTASYVQESTNQCQ